jgi:energy-coupling factor transporter ATP-binding protein EcfA2
MTTAVKIEQHNVAHRIEAALAADFIRHEKIARILALAVESGKNVLLWGPGGHGKSEMVELALAQVAAESDIYVQSFGEGMDEATLWGGLDFRALETEKVLQYFPEDSFLAKPYAVFEEIFDAPANVLLALKDTLTSKTLRKGSQQFPMATKTIVAITNKDPDEISDMGPAAHALIERFPLQLCVDWDSYESSDYNELFKKVGPRLPGADLNGTQRVLAEIIAKAGEEGDIISPRTAIHALGVCKTSAAIRGSNLVEKEDLIDLQFLPGMEDLADNISAELHAAYERAAAEGKLAVLERQLAALRTGWDTPLKALQAAKKLQPLQDEAANIKVPDGLTDRRKNVREAIAQAIDEAQTRAMELTRV